MTDSEKHPWESDPDAWKEQEVEISPSPEVRSNLLASLDRYAAFLGHQNEVDDSMAMSDKEWIYLANNAIQMIWSSHDLDPSVASRETIEHLESLIRDAHESLRDVGIVEKRVRVEIVEGLNKLREALKE